MRALAVAALLLLVAFAVPYPAAAPPGMMNHLEPVTGTLGPLQNRTLAPLGFDGSPLIGGWLFLLQAQTSGFLRAELSIGMIAKNWTFSASGSWYGTTVLPVDGYYNLTLRNPGSGVVTFSLYYDQSCSCVSKQFPVDPVARRLYVPSGYVVFNADVPGPSTVAAEFTKPAALTLRITAATLAQAGGVWPGDFALLGTTETPVQRQADPGIPPVWLYELGVSVPQAARVYYFVEAVSFDPANATQYATIVSFQARPPPAPQFPFVPVVLLGFAVALSVAGGAILWRGRRRPSSKADSAKGRSKAGTKGKGARTDARPRGGGRGGPGKRKPRGGKRRA